MKNDNELIESLNFDLLYEYLFPSEKNKKDKEWNLIFKYDQKPRREQVLSILFPKDFFSFDEGLKDAIYNYTDATKGRIHRFYTLNKRANSRAKIISVIDDNPHYIDELLKNWTSTWSTMKGNLIALKNACGNLLEDAEDEEIYYYIIDNCLDAPAITFIFCS